MVKQVVKGCVRWLGKHAFGCARQPEADSFGDFDILSGPSSTAAASRFQPKPTCDGLLDQDGVHVDCSSSSGFGCHNDDSQAGLESEVDAILDGLAVSGIFVPALDPHHNKQRADSASLLQHSTCSAAWVASLRVPGSGGGSANPQPMLVKTHCFYSDRRVATLLAAAARSGKPAVHMPTERDAMREVRTVVKVALAGSRTSAPMSVSAPLSAFSFATGSVGGQQQPVHVEVRRCSLKSSSGPDFEVVAVYPYGSSSGPINGAADDEDGQAYGDGAAPRAHQQRIEAWLHDSAAAATVEC